MRSILLALSIALSTLIPGPLVACDGPFARIREAREARIQARGNQSCKSAAAVSVPACATCPQSAPSHPAPAVIRVVAPANPPSHSTVIQGDCPNGQCPNARR